MGRILITLFLICLTIQAKSQTGQLSISRIDPMPNSPSPLQIRDWNTVARNYDNFVFNMTKTGQYLPLSRLGTKGQFNYSENTPLFLDSYVGAEGHLNQTEGINIIPAIVGASLAGIDKSNQDGINWVAKTRDFFNLANGQNVYLNNYSTTSGSDWWYDVMPNVYFYQLKYLYPSAVSEFDSQFISVANRWLNCVYHLGGSSSPWKVPSMNYRAFNLSTGLPLSTGVPEPESAGSISWLLYNAYLETGNRKYFEGAQMAMDFLAEFPSNPSYELQLPYATLAAARMNAVEGTSYPLQKLLEWCFNRGNLRGWGAITGKWGDYDVSGLIGEANDAGNDYAFVMNGFQQAAALAPLPKYDKRYAHAIAKWILNVSNASRLFYWNALPQLLQDSYSWASAYDPTACIPYESMKENWLGKSPFATGDALRGGWASTNLSLYSGSSVGYLAAVASATNIPEILRIDLNKTDFYGENSFPSFLYYNPLTSLKQVTVDLPDGNFAIYDAITEKVLNTSVNGSFLLSIPAGEVRLIRIYSSSLIPVLSGNRLYAGSSILDFQYNYDFSKNLRIKALSTEKSTLTTNSEFIVYSEPGNGIPEKIEWFLNEVLITGQTGPQATFMSPELPASLIVKCRLTADNKSIEDTLRLQVYEKIPSPPVINGIQTNSEYTVTGDEVTLTALVENDAFEDFEYAWTTTHGNLNQSAGVSVIWATPENPVVADISLTVTNTDMLSTTFTKSLLVKDTGIAVLAPIIYYPFDIDSKNASSDRFHAVVSGAAKTDDPRGAFHLAYRFTSGQNIIYTDINPDLNFTNAVSLSCWVKCEQLNSERFIISHGSWQQRYKLSITPEGRIRWTVKTSAGVSDLDSSEPIELNRYYHVCALYTGYSLELYIDGQLDTFKPFSGAILTSTKPLTLGRMDNIETQYSLLGSLDEVKIWDAEIPVSQIEMLKDQWFSPAGIIPIELNGKVYPNPATADLYIQLETGVTLRQILILNTASSEVGGISYSIENNLVRLNIPQSCFGLHFLKMIHQDGNITIKKIIIL